MASLFCFSKYTYGFMKSLSFSRVNLFFFCSYSDYSCSQAAAAAKRQRQRQNCVRANRGDDDGDTDNGSSDDDDDGGESVDDESAAEDEADGSRQSQARCADARQYLHPMRANMPIMTRLYTHTNRLFWVVN